MSNWHTRQAAPIQEAHYRLRELIEKVGLRTARWRRHVSKRAAKKALKKGHAKDGVEWLLKKAAKAQTKGNAGKMSAFSEKLLRHELCERAWELRVGAAKLMQESPVPEWEGDDLANRSILVRTCEPRNRIGEELRLARFIAPVAKQARRTIVLAEPRLVPLLHRSFPSADVRPRGVDDAAAFAEVDVAAYYATVAFHYAKSAEELRRSLVPLRPDPARVQTIRRRYQLQSDGPLVGISWWSRNKRKALPDLESWEPLLSWTSATFVSLQYGDIKDDLKVLQGLAGGRLIHDSGIDQFADLDGFAAQIAALDAVVSINNTSIDMAGMLRVPTLHIRDDNAFSIWPASGPSPWYPEMMFFYKRQRPWSELFAEVTTSLEQMMPMAVSLRSAESEIWMPSPPRLTAKPYCE